MFDPPPQKLVIGLPIFNEAERLRAFLDSLKPNIEKLRSKDGVQVEIVACLNGTTDHSREILEAWNKEQLDSQIKIISLRKKGKFRAQRTIAHYAEDRPILFADTDTILDENCFPNLWRELNRNPKAYVVSAAGQPTIPEYIADSPFIRMQKAYYQYRKQLPERQYFAGAAFIIRDNKAFTENLSLGSRIRNLKKGNYLRSTKDGGYLPSQKDAKRFIQLMGLSADGGPPTDDQYLSLWAVYHYGIKGIKTAENAKLKYTPPLTIKDFIDEKMRSFIALRTILWLFPKFNYAEELLRTKHLRIMDYLNRQTD